jgi:hypothetical protein
VAAQLAASQEGLSSVSELWLEEFMIVLSHILAVVCEMFSETTVMTDGQIGEDQLRDPRFESSGFLPVGTPKTTVCAAPVGSEEALHRGIDDFCQTIRNYPGIFERMRWLMMRRVEACVQSRGRHFEHVL